jgi:hypothetical protein
MRLSAKCGQKKHQKSDFEAFYGSAKIATQEPEKPGESHHEHI